MSLKQTARVNYAARWQQFSPLARNGYALILNTILSSGVGLLYWMLAARYYPAEIVGINSALISTMMFLSGLAELNLTNTLLRFIPGAGRMTGRLIGYAYGLSLAVALVVTLLFTHWPFMADIAQELPTANPKFALWFVGATILWSIFALQDYVLIALRAALWVLLENTFFGLFKLLLLVILAERFQQYGIFASWTLPLLLVVVPINLLIFRHFVPQHARRAPANSVQLGLRPLLTFAAGDYIASLFTLTSITLLPLVVLNQAGSDATAYLYLAWTLTYPLQMISLNMTAALTVESATAEASLAAYSRRILGQTLMLLSGVVLIMVVAAPAILRIFGGGYAAEGTALMRLLVLAALPYSVNATAVAVARVQKRMKAILVIEATLCLLALGLSHVLLPRWGITGVGIAWLVSQTSVAVILGFTQLQLLFTQLTPKNVEVLSS